MKIVIGSDRAGFPLKEHLKKTLTEKGHELTDVGTTSEERISHPVIAKRATAEFLKGGYDFGVLICASGTGICIAANKVRRIRCALLQNFYSAKVAREFNKANFIAFGGATLHPFDAESLVAAFMSFNYKGTELDWGARWDAEIDAIEDESCSGIGGPLSG